MESITVRPADLEKFGGDLRQLRAHSLEKMSDPEYVKWLEEQERLQALSGSVAMQMEDGTFTLRDANLLGMAEGGGGEAQARDRANTHQSAASMRSSRLSSRMNEQLLPAAPVQPTTASGLVKDEMILEIEHEKEVEVVDKNAHYVKESLFDNL